MSTNAIGLLFSFITLIYILAQLALVIVGICFWSRYPRPSLYLIVMASLEMLGAMLQSALQYLSMSGVFANINNLVAHAAVSIVRLGFHLLALFFLVMAVYVARRPSPKPLTPGFPPQGTSGSGKGEQALSLDPSNPYTPPRQPR